MEDRKDAQRMLKACDLCSVLWDMDLFLRNRLKYERLPDNVDQALQNARDKLHELMHDNGINLDELYN